MKNGLRKVEDKGQAVLTSYGIPYIMLQEMERQKEFEVLRLADYIIYYLE